MRRFLLLCLALSSPAWPNACTLSGSYVGNLSASGGKWTGAGCTGATYIPSAPDTVYLASGVHLTIDQNWTIGASGAKNTTPAIQMGASTSTSAMSIEVASGVTLTVRGDVLYARWTGTATDQVIMDAGSTWVFDSSQAASPTTTRYRFGWDGSGGAIGEGNFRANGTAGSHVTVTSSNVNGALNGQFRSGSNAVGASPNLGMHLNVTYTDFSNIGDTATYGESFAPYEYTGDGGTFTLTYSTLTNCGPWYTGLEFTSGMTVLIDHNLWQNSPQATSVPQLPLNADASGGNIVFSNNVLDRCPGGGGAGNAMVHFTGNYFPYSCTGGVGTRQPLADNIFIEANGITGEHTSGDISSGYIFLSGATDNPHWTSMSPYYSETFSNVIFDDPFDVTSDSGEMLGPCGASGLTCQLKNSILLPTRTGKGNSELSSLTSGAPPSGAIVNETHNTWVGSTAVGAFALQQVDEAGASIDAVNQLESNLAWSNGGGYYNVYTLTPSGPRQNPVTTADYNFADANAIPTIVCAACTNQGRSYISKWSATPGAHDIEVVNPTVTRPYLADPSRNMATFDIAYLHQAVGTPWQTSTAYTVGQIVSDSHAGYYGGTSINFRCIANHTSAAATEPMVGASWLTDWELASLYDIRTQLIAGTNYPDGAIGCAAGCTVIQALEGWVKRGFTPQHPALWCAGHDGETIGAVPFCAAGKLMLGSVAGM